MIAEDAMDAFILGAGMPISVLGSSREALPTFTSYYPRLGLFVLGFSREVLPTFTSYCKAAMAQEKR